MKIYSLLMFLYSLINTHGVPIQIDKIKGHTVYLQ